MNPFPDLLASGRFQTTDIVRGGRAYDLTLVEGAHTAGTLEPKYGTRFEADTVPAEEVDFATSIGSHQPLDD